MLIHQTLAWFGGRESTPTQTAGDHRGWRAARLADGVPRRSFDLLCELRAGISEGESARRASTLSCDLVTIGSFPSTDSFEALLKSPPDRGWSYVCLGQTSPVHVPHTSCICGWLIAPRPGVGVRVVAARTRLRVAPRLVAEQIRSMARQIGDDV